jgi:hypothetical protein
MMARDVCLDGLDYPRQRRPASAGIYVTAVPSSVGREEEFHHPWNQLAS